MTPEYFPSSIILSTLSCALMLSNSLYNVFFYEKEEVVERRRKEKKK